MACRELRHTIHFWHDVALSNYYVGFVVVYEEGKLGASTPDPELCCCEDGWLSIRVELRPRQLRHED